MRSRLLRRNPVSMFSLSRRGLLGLICALPLSTVGCASQPPSPAPANGLPASIAFQSTTFNEAAIIHLLENTVADKEDATAIRTIMQDRLPQKRGVSIISISLKTAEAIRSIDREYPNDVLMTQWRDVPAQSDQKDDTIPRGVFVQAKNGIICVDVAQVSFRNFKGLNLPTISVTNGTMPFKGAVLIAINNPEDDITPGFIVLGGRNHDGSVHEWMLVVPKDARGN